MACRSIKVAQDLVRDEVEAELAACGDPAELVAAGAAWWGQENDAWVIHEGVPEEAMHRWPVLSAWRWLVPTAGSETRCSGDVTLSAPGTRAEGPCDLAYRCVLPAELGRVLNGRAQDAGAVQGSEQGSSDEGYATGWEGKALAEEAEARTRARRRCVASIQVTTVLSLGVRKLRAEYAARIETWLRLRALVGHCVVGGATVCYHIPTPGANSRVVNWATSEPGRIVISELRWRVLPREALLRRVRTELGGLRGLRDGALVPLVQRYGVPVLVAGSQSWGPTLPDWQEARAAWQFLCACRVRDPDTWACDNCGGCQVPRPSSSVGVRCGSGICPW